MNKDALEMVMQTGGEVFGKGVFSTEKLAEKIFFPVNSNIWYSVLETILARALEESIQDSVYEHDKIGLLLSGGVDSSLLLHLVRAQHPEAEIIAYHTDFGVPERSELADAKLMAEHEGVELRVVDVSSRKQIPFINESFSMMKIISYGTPSVYMAFDKMRQDGVHFALNALGLDELMAGYTIHKRYFNRTRLAVSPFINMANRPVRYLMHKFGNAKAFMLSNTFINPAIRLVKNVELDIHSFYKKINAGNLWDTIQQWTYVTMRDNFATLIRRGAWANGIRVAFPYMNYKLMKYCHNIIPSEKFNKAPIRWLMRNVYKIPEQIVRKGENWDKIGWGGTPLPYFEDTKYMKEISTNSDAIKNWFSDKAIDKYSGKSNRVHLQMLIFTKMLEVLE